MIDAPFPPIRTERLLLRPARQSDCDALVARRNDPAVAELQAWTLPFLRERGEAILADAARRDRPVDDHWWMLTIADSADARILGDYALRLSWQGRTAELGYTLASEHWRRGYAVEATRAVVAALFDRGVHRVAATMHPENRASAQVVERCGLRYEGRTKESFWVGDDPSDDLLYGAVRADWEAWEGRPRTAPTAVRLVEIDADNELAVRRLRTHESQLDFVAPVLNSFADALVPEIVDGAPLAPWMRAVEADGELVGFVMVATRTEAHPEPYLWRLLIDRLHQRRGIGTRVLDLLVDQCRAWGDTTLLVSWVPGRGSPEPMYLAYGFEPTGRIIDGEVEARLTLERS